MLSGKIDFQFIFAFDDWPCPYGLVNASAR